ncbi:type VI secretion protein IcmF/TssM N-terminal domain-containing protein [Azospirillum agricola]|uniref:type VI secretion protein IcmF/TssM N-terminal domain-containing protein n=1 Tax=Azospirillum agricola TaxID=1720247 RepID=UPI000A0F14AD|nr:type VI secretion protein IcmF/TssM N-terminal domain-containing protein [Azospirillum agricola]SMH63019.1 ImcF-related N-terminal domain-containing protein [Azospirillum lipoferum]
MPTWTPLIPPENHLLVGLALALLAIIVLLLLAWAVWRAEWKAPTGSVAGTVGFDPVDAAAARRPVDIKALSASFIATLRTLKTAVPGAAWKYDTPWVLLLGDHGSGKSALASAIGLHRPFDLNADPELAQQGCAWHVFERGIVLDPPGGILWGDGRKGGAEAGWRRLLQLLLRHRAERGLDAVVVTVPCTDLVGPDRLDPAMLVARAKRLRLRLRELQQQLGLRLPVYLVVTKCDALPGFASFCEPLAAERGTEMFGWSNGQTLETAYGPHLVGEAFDAMGRALHRALIGGAAATGGISDMAFLFPAEFQKLAAPLGRLADGLFRADSFQDPHFFRGLFVTGDGGALAGAGGRSGLPVPLESAPLAVPALGDAVMVESPGARPLFVTSLFGDKIFREARVVQPARRSLVARSRAVRNVQLAIGGAILVLAAGLWHSHRMAGAAIASLAQPMSIIEESIEDMQKARQAGDSLTAYRKLREVAPQILGAFKTVGDRALWVPFIPTSWISPIAEEVKEQLVQGFRLVVLDSLRYELISRWTDLQARNAKPLTAGSDEMVAFQRARSYLDEIDRLAVAVTLYRNAKQLPVRDVAALVKELLGIDLGAALRNDPLLYADVMNRVVIRPLDTERNLAPSRATMARLSGDAARLITVQDGPLVRPFSVLASTLERVELARFGPPEGAGGALQDLGTALQRAQAVLDDPNLRWLFVRNPERDAVWQDRLPRIRSNLFLGPEAANEALAKAIEHVDTLRANLLGIRAPGLGPLLVSDEGADGLLRLAPALADLATALPDILRYDFMADIPVRQPEVPSQRGAAIQWMPEPLEKAVRQYRSFEAMEAGSLARVPEALRPMLQALVAQRLQGAMLTAVAEAQVVEKRGQDFRLVADETGLLREVRQFARASRPLGDLLGAFGRRGFEQGYTTVSAIVAQHLVGMLEQADRIADQGAPYLPIDEFRDWDGTLPLNADGWQVLSDVELSQYLDNTRGRFDWLGNEIAAPIVNFALREQTPGALRNDPHVTKWQRILIEQQRYKADNPNSSLAALERTIRFDLGEAVKPDNCLQQLAAGGGLGGGFGSGADFFLQRRDTLRRLALAQCQRVAARTMSTDYARLAADFNGLLAGRYPFAEYQGPDTPQADTDAVAAFLERFAIAEPGIRRGFGTPAPGTPAAQALEFVGRMAAVRDFLAPFLAASSAAPPGYDVTADFRVNRPRESGGNQIIDWAVTVGDQRLQRGGDAKAARWSPGQPVSVSLRWAKDAPVVPLSIIGPDGGVQPDRAIAFSFADRWSLVRLLQAHRAPPADLPKLTDPQPHTLKFSADTGNVPVMGEEPPARAVPGGRTSVFLRLALSTANPDGKTRTTYSLPVFPYAAPRLDVPAGARVALDPQFDDAELDDPLAPRPTRLVPRKPVPKGASR